MPADDPQSEPRNPHLTDREHEILSWITCGKSDWEIGTILHISTKTVNFHVENAKRKLGSASRVAAVTIALRDGLLPFPARVPPRPNGPASP